MSSSSAIVSSSLITAVVSAPSTPSSSALTTLVAIPPAAPPQRVKRTYSEDAIICQRLLKRNLANLSGAAVESAAKAEYASAEAGEGIWSAICPERRGVILSTLSADRMITFRKYALGKYTTKAPYKTNSDMLLELKEKATIDVQFGVDPPATLTSEISRIESLISDVPESSEHVYKSKEGARSFMSDGTQSLALAHVTQFAVLLDNMYAKNVQATESAPDAAAAQVRDSKSARASAESATRGRHQKALKRAKKDILMKENTGMRRNLYRDSALYN